ncbi:MAG: DUF4350 domain-containing protein [Akkermansiaceae bacterium]|nr:DUF4350 domain-containing protein [Akkermansiaceae bacterium]
MMPTLHRLLGGLLIGLFLVSSVSCQKTVKKRRTIGYKGEARGNAFLAAQRMLQNLGKEVVSQRSIGDLNYGTSTLFLSPSSLNTEGRMKRILRWVDNGGHLVVMLASGEKRGNDFSRYHDVSSSSLEDGTPGLDYLLEELHVELVDWDHRPTAGSGAKLDRDDWEAMAEEDRALLGAEKVDYSLGGRKMTIHHWSDKGLEYDARFNSEYGTGSNMKTDKHRYLSMFYGRGRVSLLTDASPLRNRYIGYGDHARFVSELVNLSREGTIVFTDGGGDNFFTMVWRYFWMAVIGLAAVITFWLWKNLPRFGPPQDLPKSEVREFSGQVRGIGRFLWRHKRDDTMLASLRGTVSRRLSLGADGNHEGVFEQLAERTGLPVESIIEAMTRNQVREPGVMVRVVKNLQHILKTIN